MSKIEFRNVSFSYETDNKAVNILDGLNFKVEEGEFACLIGPSGCGKSTLVSLLLGLQFPTKGEILINDKPVTGPDVNRGMVFQHYSLFPWLTAKKNIMFGIKEAGILKNRKEIAKRAEEYLELVGLADSANKYPHELSGGMQQRVALARAFADGYGHTSHGRTIRSYRPTEAYRITGTQHRALQKTRGEKDSGIHYP